MSDLIQQLPPAALEGLRDHAGDRWLFVDLDPTKMTTLLHTAADDPARPRPHHARQRLAAPGYPGRKRADLVRSRMTALLAPAGVWLCSIAQPGNGQRTPMLREACARLRAFRERVPAGPPLVVRADGEFGYAVYAATIRDAGHHYLVRCVDYRPVLTHPEVQAVLARGSARRLREPSSRIERELFDVPALRWQSADRTTEVLTRVVITRCRLPPNATKPAVGHLHEGWVYELMVTDLPAAACSAAEVVSLYLGRGLLECALGHEDEELPTDRWICSEPRGQDLFQLLCQWVWNRRVTLGHARLGDVAVRRTDWTVRVVAQAPTPIVSLPTGLAPAASPRTDAAEPTGEPAADAPPVTAPAAVVGGVTRFGPEHFVRAADGVVRCPAGVVMRRVELRVRRRGVRERLRAPAADCRACAQRRACRGADAPFMDGRIVDLPRHSTAPAAAAAAASAVRPTAATPVAPDAPAAPPPARVTQPVKVHLPRWQYDVLRWTDLAASHARTTLMHALARERFEWIAPAAAAVTDEQATTCAMTRDQRARRGCTWEQLAERNACPPERRRAQIVISGIAPALAAAIGVITRPRSLLGYRNGSAPESPGPVATA